MIALLKEKYAYFLFLIFFSLLSSCLSYRPVIKYDSAIYEIKPSLADSAMNAHIAPYKSEMDQEMNVILAVSQQPMERGTPAGLLGNFVTDVILKKSKEYCADSCNIDFCVLNNGGLRNSLPKGNITRGNVFELMPFENTVVIVTLNGSEIKELADFIANKGGVPVSGLRMKIKNGMASEVTIGERALDLNRRYTVSTSDYLANGGDNMTFFSKTIRTISTGKKVRDIIIEHLSEENQKGRTIVVKEDGRIYEDK